MANNVYIKFTKEIGISLDKSEKFYGYDVVIFDDFESHRITYSKFEELLEEWKAENVKKTILSNEEILDLFSETISYGGGVFFVPNDYEWIPIKI